MTGYQFSDDFTTQCLANADAYDRQQAQRTKAMPKTQPHSGRSGIAALLEAYEGQDAWTALRDAMARSFGWPVAAEHPAVRAFGLHALPLQNLLAASGVVAAGERRMPADVVGGVRAALRTDAVPSLLSDVAEALAFSVWAQAMDSMSYCRVFELPDYRPAAVGRCSLGAFEAPGEGGLLSETPFELGAESLQVRRYAAKLGISLEAMTGDRAVVNALLEQPLHAGMRQIRAAAAGALVANAELADGLAAFHADRNNTITSGSVNVSTFDDAFDKLANIELAEGGTLDQEPRIVVCSTANAGTMRTLLEAMGWPVSVRPHRAVPDGTYFVLPDVSAAPVVALGVPEGGNPLTVDYMGQAGDADVAVWKFVVSYGTSLVSPYGVMVTA